MMDNFSLSDIKAAVGDDGKGFDGAWWIIILFLFVFMGGGNNLFGGNKNADGANAYVTVGQFEQANNFQTLDRKLNDIGDGLCNLGYTQANLINQNSNMINGTITSEGRALQTQLADCCCATQLAVKDIQAQNDKNTCSITTAIHAEGEATRALFTAQEMQHLRDENMRNYFASLMCGVVRYPEAMTYNAGKSPFCCATA